MTVSIDPFSLSPLVGERVALLQYAQVLYWWNNSCFVSMHCLCGYLLACNDSHRVHVYICMYVCMCGLRKLMYISIHGIHASVQHVYVRTYLVSEK